MLTETPRLVLRDFQPDDFDFLLALSGDPDVSQTNDYLSADEVQLRVWLEDTLTGEAKQPRESHHSVILNKTTGQRMGWIGFLLSGEPDERRVDFGYVLSPAHWNQGYMTEAVWGMLAYCFEVLDVQVVTAFHLENNPSSGRVMLKAGMLPYEEAMQKAPAGEVHFFLTAEAWRESGQNLEH